MGLDSKEKKFEVWIEGYAASGERGQAYRLGSRDRLWKGSDFKDVCKNAIARKAFG